MVIEILEISSKS